MQHQVEMQKLAKLEHERTIESLNTPLPPAPAPPLSQSYEVAVDVDQDGEDALTNYDNNYNVSYVCVVVALMLWVFINPFYIILIVHGGGGLRLIAALLIKEEWARIVYDKMQATPKLFLYGGGCSLFASFVLCHFSFLILTVLALVGTYTAKAIGLDTGNAGALFTKHLLSDESHPQTLWARIKGVFNLRSRTRYAHAEVYDTNEHDPAVSRLSQNHRFGTVSEDNMNGGSTSRMSVHTQDDGEY